MSWKVVVKSLCPCITPGNSRRLKSMNGVSGGIDGWNRLCDDNMTWPELTWPELTWPDLPWTDLTWTDLTWTDLNWPDLTWTDLTWPDLTWCPWNAWVFCLRSPCENVGGVVWCRTFHLALWHLASFNMALCSDFDVTRSVVACYLLSPHCFGLWLL